MNRVALLPTTIGALALASFGFSNPARAGAKNVELPADGVVVKPSTLPGYAKAQAICAACRSAETMQYQVATALRAYWGARAMRMKGVFKAPIADEDVPMIVDDLAKTYGSEAPK